MCFFFFKQKTAYEMRISDWSSDVCSSDLAEEIQLEAFDPADRDAGITAQRHPEAGAGRGPAVPSAVIRIVLADRGGRQAPADLRHEIGRASCRERVCQYV